jgi:hypothetical protein
MPEAAEMRPWEHKLVSMGNSLEPDVELRANALGKQGWELVAIDAGVWVFMRPAPEESLPSGPLEAIIEETVPVAAPASADVVAASPAPALPTTAVPAIGLASGFSMAVPAVAAPEGNRGRRPVRSACTSAPR